MFVQKLKGKKKIVLKYLGESVYCLQKRKNLIDIKLKNSDTEIKKENK